MNIFIYVLNSMFEPIMYIGSYHLNHILSDLFIFELNFDKNKNKKLYSLVFNRTFILVDLWLFIQSKDVFT